MIPPRVRHATLFAFGLHGLFILTARYHLSYDAYVHMFFGDHYRADWWALWDPRWYAGFQVSSYPPLVHQLIGLLSHAAGTDAAFAALLWLTVSLYPLGIYAFSQVFVSRRLAEMAALAGAFLPSIYLAAHIFGQLPFLLATLVALFASAATAEWLRSGKRLDGLLSVALMAVVMAAHHAVLLLLPLLFACVGLHLWLTRQVAWKTLAVRLAIFGLASVCVMLVVVWPFWDWGRLQTLQVPIDHLSRHSFFEGWLAPAIFFLPFYGPLIALLPLIPLAGLHRRRISLAVLFVPLFLLGLGGTTPLPRWLFGRSWEWLTYDRFSLWASLAMLPLLVPALVLLSRRFGRRGRSARRFRSLLAGMAVFSCLVAGFSSVFPLQPGAVDMQPVVRFLAQGDRSRWRYLTFGFGDQLALLSTLTPATTIDGSYHTARELPELRSSGLAQIDTAFWNRKGLAALDPILQQAGRRGVRWGFVNVKQYVPVLERNGWVHIETLRGGVQVWENPDALLPQPIGVPQVPPLESFSWGVLPLLSLLAAGALGSARLAPIQGERLLRGAHALFLGLLPVALCFWYYRPAGVFPHERVYFTYTDALFFVADGLALAAVIVWLAMRAASSVPLRLTPWLWLLLGLCAWSSLSTLWSLDWRSSLYLSLHLWLCFGLVLSLRDWPGAWQPIMLGFCAAIAIQTAASLAELGTQSTAFLAPLHMKWPGLLDAFTPGASIVGSIDGGSFLRAYGTLPHPNILGGFLFLCLTGPAWVYLRKQPNRLAPVLLQFGVAAIALAFSRSAWLACLAAGLFLAWKSRPFNRLRFWKLAAWGPGAFLLTLLPLRGLVLERTLLASSHAEQFSGIARSWLAGQALAFTSAHPVTGLGMGSFILELARTASANYIIEPVHNLPLLAGSELGLPGLLLLGVIALLLLRKMLYTTRPQGILAAAGLLGLGVIALFDHYLWTLAPGRLMLALALGLWAGQDAASDG